MLQFLNPGVSQKVYTILTLLLFGTIFSVSGQSTLGEIKDDGSTSCNISIPVCDGDTIRLSPTNTTGYTNFQWYMGSVAMGNEIDTPADDASVFAVSNDSITVITPGGTYILTGEYATPSGCMTLNDTITLDFQPIPDLATTPDTICTAGGESIDLATLVTDNNSAPGTAKWYASLADAMAEMPELGSTTVSPNSTTKYYVRQTSTGTAACYDIDSVQVVVSCLSLGNIVWYDTDNSGTLDGGENTIDDVIVNLFLDADGNGVLEGAEQTPYAKDTTTAGGKYLFENLPEGEYFVGIPSSEFGSGEPLENLYSSQTAYDASGNISETTANDADAINSDVDDNGTLMGAMSFYNGGVLSSSVELTFQDEPTGESPDDSTNDDKDGNMTVDFGFYGMSIGSYVFSDINNNGTYDSGTESGINGAEVRLYVVTATDTTFLTSTTTDGMGRYLFSNLPEGDYMVGVLTPSGTVSSDDIGTSSTPNSTDDDDNGIRVLADTTFTSAFTLDAGNAPTGESGPAIADGDNPDNNSNLNVDLGFKPSCVVISNPMGAQSVCAGTAGNDLTVDFSTNAQNIRFVQYTTQQMGTDMYTGGTGLDTVTVTGAGPTYLATLAYDNADFPNATTASITYYVYAVLENTPADPTCRPFQEIQVTVNPQPTATAASLTVCENTINSDIGTFTLTNATMDVLNGQSPTGLVISYHATQAHADAGTPVLTATVDSLNTSVVYARVESSDGNCYATAPVTLNTNPKPNFGLTTDPLCPGDDPKVVLTLGADSDANPNVEVNSGGEVLFNTLPNASGTGMGATADITTAVGLNLNASNTVRVENATGCDNSNTINPGGVVSKVCLPVKIEQLNNK